MFMYVHIHVYGLCALIQQLDYTFDFQLAGHKHQDVARAWLGMFMYVHIRVYGAFVHTSSIYSGQP